METVLFVNGVNVCDNIADYGQFKEFIETHTPLQTWIEPIPYKDTQGNDVAASALTVLDYQTEDNTDYAAGWYGLNDVEDLSIPANISKAGTSAVPSSIKTNEVPAIFKKSFVRFYK